jgi:hypothetical protein
VAGDGRKKGDHALLLALAAGQSVPDAARAAHLGESTAYRRLRDSDFRARLDEVRAALIGAAVDKLAELGYAAVDQLRTLIEGGQSETVRLGAARAALDYLFRANEQMALTREVAELKALVEEARRGGGSTASPSGEAPGDPGSDDDGTDPAPGPPPGGPQPSPDAGL